MVPAVSSPMKVTLLGSQVTFHSGCPTVDENRVAAGADPLWLGTFRPSIEYPAWIVMMAASLLQTVYMPLSFLAIPELS